MGLSAIGIHYYSTLPVTPLLSLQACLSRKEKIGIRVDDAIARRDSLFHSSMKVLSSVRLYAVASPHVESHTSPSQPPLAPPDDLGLIYSPSAAAENHVTMVSQSESGARWPHERTALTVVWTPSGPDRARPSSTSRNSLPPGAGRRPPSLCHAPDARKDGRRAD